MKESGSRAVIISHIYKRARRFNVYFAISRVTGDEKTNVYRDDEAKEEENERFTGRRSDGVSVSVRY